MVAIRCHPVSGKILSNELRSAIESAKFWHATLLGYSLDRFVRHPDFSPSDPSTWKIPAPVLKRFLEMAKGVNVMTLLPTGTSPNRVWSWHTRIECSRLRGSMLTETVRQGGPIVVENYCSPSSAGCERTGSNGTKYPGCSMCPSIRSNNGFANCQKTCEFPNGERLENMVSDGICRHLGLCRPEDHVTTHLCPYFNTFLRAPRMAEACPLSVPASVCRACVPRFRSVFQ